MIRNIVFSMLFLFLILGCKEDKRIESECQDNRESIENTVQNTNINNDSQNKTNKIKTKLREEFYSKNNESTKIEKIEVIDNNEITISILPPEIETPIVNGLRVNVFAEKKKYKLGDPMNIIVVLRNKSNKLIKLETEYYKSDENVPYFNFTYIIYGESGFPHTGAYTDFPPVITNYISPNAVYCYVIDIKSVFIHGRYCGKFKLHVDYKRGTKSNTIEFEVVE